MKKHRRLIEDSEVINFRVVLVARMYVEPSLPNFPNENSPESSHMVQYRQTINNFLIAPFCPHTTRRIRHHFSFLFIWKTSVVVTGWKLWDVGTRWRKDIPSSLKVHVGSGHYMTLNTFVSIGFCCVPFFLVESPEKERERVINKITRNQYMYTRSGIVTSRQGGEDRREEGKFCGKNLNKIRKARHKGIGKSN
jgi:hypothetical protein